MPWMTFTWFWHRNTLGKMVSFNFRLSHWLKVITVLSSLHWPLPSKSLKRDAKSMIYTAAAEQVVAESIKSITLQPLILFDQITTPLHIWSLWVRFDVLSPLRFTALPLQSLKYCSIFLQNRDTALTTLLFHSLQGCSQGRFGWTPLPFDCGHELWAFR